MKETSKRFKALANKNRLAIFEYLRQNEEICVKPKEGCNVGDIARQFNLALSTISHHLKVLHDAGLIRCEQQGQYTYCRIDWDVVKDLRHFLDAVE